MQSWVCATYSDRVVCIYSVEIYFGREFPVVSLRSSGSQFAKSWKFARNFCVFWKNDPYDKIFKIMFGKFTSRHRSTLLCAKFVKTVGREIVRYLPDKNFVSLSNCRYCADCVQSLLWPAPTFGWQLSKFHPNRFTFGGVIAGRVHEGRSLGPLGKCNTRPKRCIASGE